MKNSGIKKIVALTIAGVLVIPAFFACGAIREGDDSIKPVNFPLKKEITLTIATPDFDSEVSLEDNLPVWAKIDENTNIKIEWDVIPAAQYAITMAARIEDDEKLPDIMLLPNGQTLGGLHSAGKIIPLDDYIEVNGDNIKKEYEKYPEIKKLTSVDGSIYSINTIDESSTHAPYSLAVRKDWLNRLELEEPTTTDEFVKVLRAFRDKDADGDGDPNNEIPYLPAGHPWYVTYLAYGFGLHLFYSDGWYPDEEGNIQYEFISDRAKEFVTWANMLYEEKLLYNDFLLLGDETRMYEAVKKGNVGAFQAFPAVLPSIEKETKGYNVKLSPIPALKGPYDQIAEIQGLIETNGYVVTSSCENPNEAVALMNYLYGGEGSDIMLYGIEGETYTRNSEDELVLSDAVANDPAGQDFPHVLSKYGTKMGLPFVSTLEYAELFYQNIPEKDKKMLEDITEETRDYIKPALLLPSATEEESEILDANLAGLSDYTWTYMIDFITGEKDIDANWDSFIQGTYNHGLDDILKVKQVQYNRLSE